METALSLYRKWRSLTFAEVVGQRHVTQTLRNAVRSGTVGHAYLFTGPRGTGKTSTARILARAINCLEPRDGEPCNHCAPCRAMLANHCFDVVEIDAASNNGVDNVRDLREKVHFAPADVVRKVYIIDEAHMLSTGAFNALLKTLEEPPAHVLFVLATTDVHKVPATITSRCQRLDFRTIAVDDMVERLSYICVQEEMTADDAALALIAQQATGSLRDALSLLEQVRAYEATRIGVLEVEEALGLARRDTLTALTDLIVAGDTGAALRLMGDLAAAGADMRQYAKQLVQYWRDLLLLCAGVESAARSAGARMREQAGRLRVVDVTAILKAILQPDYSGRRSAPAQWQLELAIAEACQHFARDDAPPVPTVAPASQPSSRAMPASQLSSGATPTSPGAPKAPPSTNGSAAPPLAVTAAEETAPGMEATRIEGRPAAEAPGRATQEQPVETAGAPAGAAPSRDAALIDVKRVWIEVRQDPAVKGKPSLHALLNGSCTPSRFDDDTFVLAFNRQNDWHRKQVEAAQNRGVLEEALARVIGRPVKLGCVTMDRQPAAHDNDGARQDTFVSEAERHLRAIHVDRKQN